MKSTPVSHQCMPYIDVPEKQEGEQNKIKPLVYEIGKKKILRLSSRFKVHEATGYLNGTRG